MNKYILTLALVFSTAVALADNITWTGDAHDNLWATGGNWEGGSAPSAVDTAVFPASSDVYIANSNLTIQVAGITVGDNATLNIQGGNLVPGTAATVFVADVGAGGRFNANCYVHTQSISDTNRFEKTGAGVYCQYWKFGLSSGGKDRPWGVVDIKEGVFARYLVNDTKVSANGCASEFLVRDGATIEIGGYSVFSSSSTIGGFPILTVEEGGAATFNRSSTVTLDGIRGAGVIHNQSTSATSLSKPINLKLERDDYVFSGTSTCVNGGRSSFNINFAGETDHTFTIASADAFAATGSIAGNVDQLRFAPNIGAFSLGGLDTAGPKMAPTTDTAGNPIVINIVGLGSLVKSETIATVPAPGRYAYPDGRTIGGSKAAQEGSLTITGGTVELSSVQNNSSVFAQTGGYVIGASDPEQCNVQSPMYTRMRPYNGVVWTDTDSGGRTLGRNTVSGGTLRLGGATASTVGGFSVSSGAVMELLNGWSKLSGCAEKVSVDGGTLRLCHDRAASFTVPNNSSAQSWTIQIGANGARVDGSLEQPPAVSPGSTVYDVDWYMGAETASGLGADGGLVLAYPGRLNLFRPQNVSGGLTLADGRIVLEAEAFDTTSTMTPLGTGNLNLLNAWLQCAAIDNRNMKLANGAGSVFTYGCSAVLCTRISGTNIKQEFTIGSADETNPIVRQGKGAVLVFATGSNTTPYDGVNSGNVKVKGQVDAYSNGLCKGPLFSFTKDGSNDSNYHFELMKYDSAKGFVEATDLYVADLAGGADSVAFLDSSKGDTTAPTGETTVRAVVVSGNKTTDKPLVVPSGATLEVGDGVNPAPFILNRVAGYGGARITGAGTIDFGASEGVFAVNARGAGDDKYQTKIDPTIAGTGGVTFYGAPYGVYPLVTLNGANTYSGGTWITGVQVRPTKSTSFGTGKVDIGGGYAFGGQVRFATANLTFANDFKIQGHGVRTGDTGVDATDNGALWFLASTTLSGAIEIDEAARVTTRNAAANVRATLSGAVSGGKLKLMRGGDATVALTGHNTYTGGTEVVGSTLALAHADSAGTGEIWADSSTIILENEEDVTIANPFSATGTVRLLGDGKVSFSNLGDVSGAVLDVAGRTLPLANLPTGFGSCTNASDTVATLVLAAGANTLPCNLAGEFYLQADQNATLDLGGRTVTVKRVRGRGILNVVNGTLIAPAHNLGMLLFVR